MRCELCGHVFGQKHRIHPGVWGGEYSEGNVIYLCPNHHAAIHFLMRYRHRGPLLDGDDQDRLEEYLLDPDLSRFWTDIVEPIVLAHMVDEGTWPEGALPMRLFASIPYEHRHPEES